MIIGVICTGIIIWLVIEALILCSHDEIGHHLSTIAVLINGFVKKTLKLIPSTNNPKSIFVLMSPFNYSMP